MLNFGLIGCGQIAERHAAQMKKLGNLVAVCDIDEVKLAHFSMSNNAKGYSHINDLLENERSIDLIAICTPNYLHAPHSIACLQKGVHVLCEKPMAINSEDCKKMIAAAELSGKNLFVVKQNRFNPPVAAVKKLVDKNGLGSIYSIHLNCLWNRDAEYYKSEWKGKKEKDGGILFTQFSHFIDLLYWMFGDVKEVKAFTKNFSHQNCIAFEDTGVACFLFENGAIGSIHFSINSYQKNMEGSLTILAEKGTVKIGGEYLNVLEYQQIKDFHFEEIPKGNPGNDYGTYKGSMSNHHQVYEHVVDVLTKKADNLFDGCNGLKTVEIIEKIYQAANETQA